MVRCQIHDCGRSLPPTRIAEASGSGKRSRLVHCDLFNLGSSTWIRLTFMPLEGPTPHPSRRHIARMRASILCADCTMRRTARSGTPVLRRATHENEPDIRPFDGAAEGREPRILLGLLTLRDHCDQAVLFQVQSKCSQKLLSLSVNSESQYLHLDY